MSKVFIGGSRQISRLTADITKRLDTVMANGHHVLVGDAYGVDKAVQKHLRNSAYDNVTVFSSGEPRNNFGAWPVRKVTPPKHVKGFHFYAAKDREMACEADFGFMIWDGKSAGTVLNVLRLMRAGKVAVLFSAPDQRTINIKSVADWESFLSDCDAELLRDIRERATPDEWQPGTETSLLTPPEGASAADPRRYQSRSEPELQTRSLIGMDGKL